MADRKQENPSKESSTSSGEQLELRIPAHAEWVRVVRLATAGVASRVGFSYDEVEDIKLAIAEACNNAILHSVPGASTPIVTIRWQILEDGVRISVSDEGRLAAGLQRRSTPTEESIEDLPEGGMGLILIEGLMDEVEHESGPELDTTIHMTKRLQSIASLPARTASRPDPDSPVSLRPAKKSAKAKTIHLEQ